MLGRKFNRLTVIAERDRWVSPSGQTQRQFFVRCDCGKTTIVRGCDLRTGHTTSCGCYHSEEVRARLTNRDDGMIGSRFGRLVVKKQDRRRKATIYRWFIVRCDCGTTKSVAGFVLRRGNVVSCGCYAREIHTKHGDSRTPEYATWLGMIRRCEAEHRADYPDYGGRGIKVASRWRNSYQAFLDDMGRRPSRKHSLDRINNDGDYTPTNCRWATPKQQAANRRKRRIT